MSPENDKVLRAEMNAAQHVQGLHGRGASEFCDTCHPMTDALTPQEAEESPSPIGSTFEEARERRRRNPEYRIAEIDALWTDAVFAMHIALYAELLRLREALEDVRLDLSVAWQNNDHVDEGDLAARVQRVLDSTAPAAPSAQEQIAAGQRLARVVVDVYGSGEEAGGLAVELARALLEGADRPTLRYPARPGEANVSLHDDEADR